MHAESGMRFFKQPVFLCVVKLVGKHTKLGLGGEKRCIIRQNTGNIYMRKNLQKQQPACWLPYWGFLEAVCLFVHQNLQMAWKSRQQKTRSKSSKWRKSFRMA